MIKCQACEAQNSLDSKFCKGCGIALPDAEIVAAHHALEAMLTEGNRLFQEKRTEEALMIAESAVEQDPSSVSALTLKGMCHERFNQVPEALECFEQVSALKPDSTLDKIKVTQLRKLLAAGPLTEKPLRRKEALYMAGSAGLLVIASGVIVAAIVSSRNQQADLMASNTKTGLPNDQAVPFDPTKGAVDNGGTGNPQPVNTTSSGAQQSPTDVQNPNVNRTGASGQGNGGTAPLPWVNDGGNSPLRPPVGNGLVLRGDPPPVTPTNQPPIKEIDPTPTNNPPSQPPKEEPKQDTGIVQITVNKPGDAVKGGGTTRNSNGAQSLLKSANSEYQLQHYDRAAAMYERAVMLGADPGRTNQKIGRCYEYLGKKAEALAAYDKAISSLESSVGSGAGDTEGLKAALDATKQMAKTLRGG